MFKDTSMRFLSANSPRICESNCGFSAVGYKVGHKITKGLLYFWIWACFVTNDPAYSFDIKDLNYLEQFQVCLDCDLTGVNFFGRDLSGYDLRGADLAGADLRMSKLIGIDLRGAYLADANLQGADLSGADFFVADARRANFSICLLYTSPSPRD